jgi:nitroimidazol reductase NimA-like FMN-containing flavoprotein (pyridoxamine 5'-phosphate oxidase superfamily)
MRKDAMQIGPIKEDDSLAILRRGNLGRLGCVDQDAPYVVPVNYLFDGKDIYIHSLPGRKIDAMRANSRVCLQVDEITDAFHWRSVIAFGNYEEISDPETRERMLGKLFTRLPHMTPVETRMTRGMSEMILFRIKVSAITGVSEDWGASGSA